MVPAERQREAFGPVIDILARNGVDLTRDLVEVAPMAHFMLGGVEVDATMATRVPGLWAAGELVAGMHGANRLSGNAITEALVSGRMAGEAAARQRGASPDGFDCARPRRAEWERLQQVWHPRDVARDEVSIPRLRRQLKRLMWDTAGPFRTHAGLNEGLAGLASLQRTLDSTALARQASFGLSLQEKLDLRHMLRVSRAILTSACLRRESRGAHVRLDFPQTDPVVKVVECSLGEADEQWTTTLR